MSKTIRIRTTPDGGDNFIKINMEQDFDFVEVLSLKIAQKDLYTTFCADYGAVVGRVIVNNGYGVPNAKISIFIPVSDLDRENDEIFSLYPFETVTDSGPNGLRYNLLPKTNETNDDCFTPVGDFPNKRTFLDDDRMLEIYCRYYKFTTTTNQSGDYMIFGVPVGSYTMYAEADLSDIGIISQKPYDFIRKGSSAESFDSTTKFSKTSDNIDTNTQIINRTPTSVNIRPYWGQEDACNVVITRQDINLNTVVTPHAIFMGSIFGDNEEGTINLRCRPNPKLGKLDLQTAGSGTIEMIRETLDGTIERFDIAGGKLIDSDGTWAYQIPMNLDYRVTDESGNLVPTDDPNKGIPTRARVRFRIGMDNNVSGVSRRAKYLVPHNPRQHSNNVTQQQFVGISDEFPYGKPAIDFEFGPNTSKASLADLSWNTVYSVKNYIRRYEKSFNPSFAGSRAFIGVKDVDSAGGDINPFPYNSLNIVVDPLFNFICGLVIILSTLVATINFFLITPINVLLSILNSALGWLGVDISYISCITLDCTSEGQSTPYAPGCLNNTDGCDVAQQEQGLVVCVGSQSGLNGFSDTLPPGDAGYTSCVAASLLQSLDLLEFDFFNDWVNGTLYSPLFINRNRVPNSLAEKDNFCEWSCGGFSGYTVSGVSSDGINPDNPCRQYMFVKQICGQGVLNGPTYGCPTNPYICESSSIIPNILPISQEGVGGTFIASTNITSNQSDGGYGVIVKKDNEYYYTPYARVSDDYILATDIITLGSSVSCHWLGLPSIIRFLEDTTYKIPPVIPDKDYDSSGTLITSVSGMDSENENLLNSLFFNVNCFYTSTSALQCNNIRRQCELGVGLDQNPPIVNNILDNNDLDVRISRNLFAWMNSYNIYTQNPNLTNVDTSFGNFAINTSNLNSNHGCGNMLGEPDYLTFRYGWLSPTETGILCRNKTKTLNSFYFYFGLNKNKTALSKLLEKYFSPCPIQEKTPFTIIADVKDETIDGSDGEITITIIGGTGPYTVTITSPDGTTDEYPMTGDTLTFDGLDAGSYPITVVDSNGLVNTTTIIVGGPIPLTCVVEGINVSGVDNQGLSLSDGIINITVSGGLSPYNVTITDIITTTTLFTGNATENVTLTVDNISSGSYGVLVTDSSEQPLSCFTPVGIGLPDIVNIDLIISGETCVNSCNGYIQITLDGNAPYNITLTSDNNTVINNNQIFNTTPNTPSVTITGYTNNTLSVNSLCSGIYGLIVTDANGQSIQETLNIPAAQYSEADLDLSLGTIVVNPNGNFTNGTGIIVVCPPTPPPNGETYVYQLFTSETSEPLQTVTTGNNCVEFTNLDCNGGNNYWVTYRNHLGCRFPINLSNRFEINLTLTGC
jgi:hypothetical protein